MTKNIYFAALLIVLLSLSGCSGYKPIFSSNNLDFTITEYTINGNKSLGKQLYSKLYNLSKSKKIDKDRNIILLIDMSSNKNETSKDSTGKVLEYKITLNTKIEIRDSSNNSIILNEVFTRSSSYKVQSQYSETLKLENTSTENLINQAYQDILMKFAQNIGQQ
jgi:outer membrane lipopolysaccharide assembly protein LptE/RlpB